MRYLTLGLVAVLAACAKDEFTAPPAPEGPSPVASITVSAPASLDIRENIQIVVELKDSRGRQVERDLRFTSSSYNIATVNQFGVVTGVSPGAVEITVVSESRSATISLQVRGEPNCTQVWREDWANVCRSTEAFDLVSYRGSPLPVHSPWGKGDWDYDENGGTWNLISWSYSFYTDGTYASTMTHRAASGQLDVQASTGTYTRTNSSVELKPFGVATVYGGSISGNRLTIGDFVFARK